jgi:hypothetical protein
MLYVTVFKKILSLHCSLHFTPTVTVTISTARLKLRRYSGLDNFCRRVTGIVAVFYKRSYHRYK